VAESLLPNIRKLFIPDPGHILLDCDLSGADAQVVAWESEDEDLKDAFRRGLKLHKKNAADMWGAEFTSLSEDSPQYKRLYDEIKKGVHATNYLGSARTLAITLGWTVAKAEQFQSRWFALHPGIKTKFHGRVHAELSRSRSVTNKFGFRIFYFDRIDSVFSEAVAWLPQSTVANTCFKGALQVRERLPWVQILLQVHDSLVLQIPRHRLPDIVQIRDALTNTIPYSDPLTIPWSLKLSPVSWGDAKDYKWEEAATLKL
jgi:DNA polymerase-1